MLFNLEKPQGNNIFFELIFSIIGKVNQMTTVVLH